MFFIIGKIYKQKYINTRGVRQKINSVEKEKKN